MSEFTIIPDPKQDIKFWLDALSNPNVNRESKELLNQCLQAELKNYMFPLVKIVKEDIDLDDIKIKPVKGYGWGL